MKYLFLGFLILCVYPAFAGIPQGGELKFQILRNGNPFGMHVMQFSETDEGYTRVDIDINMRVSAGPINFFKYEHSNTEIWDGDRLIKLSSETNDDGDQYFVNAKWDGDIFDIQSSTKNNALPQPIYSTSYWHPDFIQQAKLLNSQKGQIDQIQITSTEQDIINDRPATKHTLRINNERDVTIWYDRATNQRAGLQFTIKNQDIFYKRLSVF